MDLEADDGPKPEPSRRRRGRELEDALLEAAWAELVAGGYGTFTIDAVADRAGTSRPVIYRRWATRGDLALAAIRYRWDQDPVATPDTGSLRGDVIALLTTANKRRAGFAAVASVQFASYYQETGQSPAQVRDELIGRRPVAMDTIIARAIERDEVDPKPLTPRVASLPFDLFRHQLLMTLEPLTPADIVEIVDTIFLPLVLKR